MANGWKCPQCGYDKAWRATCVRCGAALSGEGTALSAPKGGPDGVFAAPVEGADGRAGRTVVVLIVLNLLVQVALFIVAVANDMNQTTSVRVSLVVGLVFYAASAGWVLFRSASLGLRPRLGSATAWAGAAEGFVVGGGIAVLMTATLRLALGHPVLDPTAAVLSADGALGPLLLGILLIVMAAPVVEELVFRGFLAEAFRGKGRREATAVSAVAFSLAHLRLADFRYYFVLGIVLALVYLRRGLVGSVTAHASFNGMLVVVALAAAHGPVVEADGAGALVTLPAAWSTQAGVAGNDLVATGPGGSQVELAHVDAGDHTPSPEALAGELISGSVRLSPQVSVDPATVRVLDFPAGRGVRADATLDGEDGYLVVIPKADRLWVLGLSSAGGSGEKKDFESIVASWRLP